MLTPDSGDMSAFLPRTSKLARPITRAAANFPTNVLIIGGAYAGLSALVALKNLLREKQQQKISVTLVEPKAGLLNIIGVPRAIVDTEFARTQYLPYQELQDVRFDQIVSNDEVVVSSLGKAVQPDNNKFIEITYVQGSVTALGIKSAEYVLNESQDTGKIEFDFAVVATGRNRTWPTSPTAYNYESYMTEMASFNDIVTKSKKIGVVGAGAVGIEIAGDIKAKHPEIEVLLVHPHQQFPPEPLPEAFKAAVKDSLVRGGVKVMTGVRVKQENAGGELEFTNGEKVTTDFNYWCTAFHNNTEMLKGELGAFVTPANNVYVNEYTQLTHPETHEQHAHIFAIGDLVEMPIIKSAGWALYMGRQVANNIVSLIVDGKVVEPMPDPTKMPRGMVLVAGNNELVSLLDGVVEYNNANYVKEYKDYCFGKVRATLGA